MILSAFDRFRAQARHVTVGGIFLTTVLAASLAHGAGTNGPSHGFALNHALKYPADFKHFDYVNPNAPKGGAIVVEGVGTFDSLNPYITRGNAALLYISRADLTGAAFGVHDTLMAQPQDEDSSVYGLVAETIEVPEDGSWVEYKLRPEARFHDGHPITAEDVAWTFQTLQEKGRPLYRYYYAAVAEILIPDDRTVRFILHPGENKEMPLILSQLAILPKHYWDDKEFEKTTLAPPLGSGPYKITKVDPGKSITYERVADYWAKDLPVARGLNNFDKIRVDYYRDRTISREAFKAGLIDIWSENSAKEWATAFDFPSIQKGHALKEDFDHERVAPMQGYAFNLRKSLFQDIRVREALTLAWDFEWVNKTIMYGAYTRTDSFFDNHELSSEGLPSDDELLLLEPLRGKIPDQVFTKSYIPPTTDGSGNNRSNLRKAVKLLSEAGWKITDGKLVNTGSGVPFEFEIMLRTDSLEPHTQPMVRSLKRLGIDATIRIVDDAQFRARVDTFDFDMVVTGFAQSVTPGNEQLDYWGSASANREGTRNTMGVRDPAVDALIKLLIAAPDRKSLVTRTRALDRVLLWNHFIIPMYHGKTDRLAFWNRFGRPDVLPKFGVMTAAWWIDPDRDAVLKRESAN